MIQKHIYRIKLFFTKLRVALDLVIEWIFSFFPSAKNPHSPIITIKPRTIDGMTPKIEHKWNPVLKYPRNEICYCRSGKKFKNCCLLRQPLAVNEEFADKAVKLVKKMRKENKKK